VEGVADVVLDMGEQRHAQGEIRRQLQVEQPWQYAAKAGGIEYKSGAQLLALSLIVEVSQ